MTCSNNSNYTEIGRRLREIPLEAHISSHEWEELVQKLCASNDNSLHKIGINELEKLNYVKTTIKKSRTDGTI